MLSPVKAKTTKLDKDSSPRLSMNDLSKYFETESKESESKTRKNCFDRQWDARFNIPDKTYLNDFLTNLKEYAEKEMRYCLVGGLEVGVKNHDQGVEHVHCIFVFHNARSSNAIIKNLKINKSLGYYIKARTRSLPFQGLIDHHKKEWTKKDKNSLCLYEYGEPIVRDGPKCYQKRSELEKKMTRNDIMIHLRQLISEGREEEAFTLYPCEFVRSGEKLKSLFGGQKDDPRTKEVFPHMWIMGPAGTGKSRIVSLLFPNAFNKNLDNRFWDLYDRNNPDHQFVSMEDVDPETFDRLGIQFFKTICDERGYPIDQKYKSPQPIKINAIISSNHSIKECISADTVGYEVTAAALERRYWQINIFDLLKLLNLKLLSKKELMWMKKCGNEDAAACFLTWDYINNGPLGEHLKTPEEYRSILRDYYYK